ncbi:MAG: hypothetical protein RLZZ393_90 [Pseudomonadota bacterium]|jgi:membrane-bound lytic murein transglycosylase A
MNLRPLLTLLCSGSLLAGCGSPALQTTPPPVVIQKSVPAVVSPAPLPAAPTPRYSRAEWGSVEGWHDDDLFVAWPAFVAGCAALKTKPDWQSACAAAAQATVRDAPSARRFFEAQFEAWRLAYDDERGQPAEQGLVTGYYEPMLNGARRPGGRFRTPLYGVPDDLLTVELSELYPTLKGERVRGRLQGRKVLPYYDRSSIDAAPSVQGKALLWTDDAVDAFFLQVQGSGRVKLTDGSVVRLAYADQNGQPYKAIGRYLVQKGDLTVEQATAQGLRDWLAAHPARLKEVLDANPSVVFFREEALPDPSVGPKGALGVPLTAGRSIAIDPRNLPLGAPVFLATTAPGSDAPLRRLVMAQDTGGAIRGVVRADFFFGLGHEAGLQAGAMRQQGRMWLLWPKGRPLPPVGPGVAPASGAAANLALQPVLDALSRSTGRRFLVAKSVPEQLRGGTLDLSNPTWPQLLALLRNNGLAAVKIEGITNIVPDGPMREYPLPVVTQDDAAVADDEWVTRTIVLKAGNADQFVRTLRPLVPQNGFLAASPDNRALVLVDRYGNTRRLIEVLRSMEK